MNSIAAITNKNLVTVWAVLEVLRAMSEKITGGELLARCVDQENIRYVFGITGDQLYPFLESMYARRNTDPRKLEFIATRHESAAAHMADAWARLTGSPGVCLGTVGPGAANLVPGVYVAHADSIPMIVITAQDQSWRSYPDHGSTQGCDQQSLFQAVTKASYIVKHWERIPELVQRAFKVSLSNKPGPVHLDFHTDILFESNTLDELKILPPERYRHVSGPGGNPRLVQEAAKMLMMAKRPLIHVGGGILRANAFEELKNVAEHLNAPVTTTIMAKGALPDDHPLLLLPASPGSGSLPAQVEADVVLAVGTSFGAYDMYGGGLAWGDPEDQKTIQIDIDAEEIALNREVDLAIVGDAKVVLEQLFEELKRLSTTPKPQSKDVGEYKDVEAEWLRGFNEGIESEDVPIHPLRLMSEVRSFFPRDAISVVDGGNSVVWSTYVNRIYEPRSFLLACDSVQLGVGIPFAMTAKLAHPKRSVYLLSGDGAFGFNLSELETARKLQTNIIAIVVNDVAWGMIKAGQAEVYQSRFIGVDLHDIRYDLIARAMDCFGELVTDPKEIRPALQRAVDSNLPAVLDVRIDPEINLQAPDFGTLAAIWLDRVEFPESFVDYDTTQEEVKTEEISEEKRVEPETALG